MLHLFGKNNNILKEKMKQLLSRSVLKQIL